LFLLGIQVYAFIVCTNLNTDYFFDASNIRFFLIQKSVIFFVVYISIFYQNFCLKICIILRYRQIILRFWQTFWSIWNVKIDSLVSRFYIFLFDWVFMYGFKKIKGT